MRLFHFLIVILVSSMSTYAAEKQRVQSHPCTTSYKGEVLYFKNCRQVSDNVWEVMTCNQGSVSCYLVNQKVEKLDRDYCTKTYNDDSLASKVVDCFTGKAVDMPGNLDANRLINL